MINENEDWRFREYLAAQEFADTMLGIVYAVDHCARLMARLGVGRV